MTITSGMAISSSKTVALSSAITDKSDKHNYVHGQNKTCISVATLDKVSQLLLHGRKGPMSDQNGQQSISDIIE